MQVRRNEGSITNALFSVFFGINRSVMVTCTKLQLTMADKTEHQLLVNMALEMLDFKKSLDLINNRCLVFEVNIMRRPATVMILRN